MAVAQPLAGQIGGIEAIAVRIERLPDACELDAEFGRRLPQQRRASAALFIIILVLDPGIVDAVDPARRLAPGEAARNRERVGRDRSEEHTSELQSLMRTSYAGFCLKKKTICTQPNNYNHYN